jgi:hypothetical protein
LVKRPFSRSESEKRSRYYYVSKKYYWLDGHFMEGEHLKEKGHDYAKNYVLDSKVKFGLTVGKSVGKKFF